MRFFPHLRRSLPAAALLALLAGCGAAPLDMNQALTDGRIKATFTSTGQSSGDVCLGKFEHVQGEAVDLKIPRGTVLRNGNDDHESYVFIQLKGKVESTSSERYKKQDYIILSSSGREFLGGMECYSLNALLASPDTSDSFTPDGMVDGKTKAVVDAIASDNIAANQLAIWATTDNLTREQLDLLGYEYKEADIDAARKLIEDAKLDPTSFDLFS